MTRYVALVDGKPGSYGLTVPDLPGCTSAAATTDEVLHRATEAVRLWAEDALADGEKLPKPRSIEALRADPEVAEALAKGAALAIVPLVLDAGRPAKANLSLDAGCERAVLQYTRWHQFFECFNNLTHGRYGRFCRHSVKYHEFPSCVGDFGDHQIGAMR